VATRNNYRHVFETARNIPAWDFLFLEPVKEDVQAEGRVIKLGACPGISALSVESASGKTAAVGIATYFIKPASAEKGESD